MGEWTAFSLPGGGLGSGLPESIRSSCWLFAMAAPPTVEKVNQRFLGLLPRAFRSAEQSV